MKTRRAFFLPTILTLVAVGQLVLLLLLSSCLGNGFFEELPWRGLYLCLFPNSIILKMMWPSVWFALWHYVPGSVSSGAHPGRHHHGTIMVL